MSRTKKRWTGFATGFRAGRPTRSGSFHIVARLRDDPGRDVDIEFTVEQAATYGAALTRWAEEAATRPGGSS